MTRERDLSGRDLSGIEELHRKDVAATLAQDPAALAELWTDDVVRLQQGEDAVIGKQAILNVSITTRTAPTLLVLQSRPLGEVKGWARLDHGR
jgi:hypothetical protein